MYDSCNGEWQIYGCGWSLSGVWEQMNLIAHVDILLLAIGLIYVLAKSGHVFRQYRSLLGASDDFGARNRRSKIPRLTADIAAIKSVATLAPNLGFVGFANGILCAFTGSAMQRGAWVALVTTRLALALVPTAAGTFVAIPAVVLHNFLHSKIETILGEEMPHERLPLGARFNRLPAFATIGAPILILTSLAFMALARFHPPMGLEVRLLQLGDVAQGRKASTLVDVKNGDGKLRIFVNGKLESLNELATVKTDPSTTLFVESEKGVPWLELMNVIDAAKSISNDVLLLTSVPEPRVSAKRSRYPTLRLRHARRKADFSLRSE